jgi:hypothetical protein
VSDIIDKGVIPGTKAKLGFKVVYAFSGATKWLPLKALAKYRIKEYEALAKITTGITARASHVPAT